MTDYLPLIVRAVEGLEKNTGEARRSLYERARNALVTQLRSVEPALSETEITKQRLALEDAIRKVEAEAARRSRAELREQRNASLPPRPERFTPPPPPPDQGRAEPRRNEPPRPAGGEGDTQNRPPSAARERLLSARPPTSSQEGMKGLRDVVSEVHGLGGASARAAQSARDTRNSYGPITPPAPPETDPEFSEHGYGTSFGHEEPPPDHTEYSPGPGYPPRYEEDQAPLHARYAQQVHAEDDEHYQPRPPRSYRGLVQILVALLVLVAVAGVVTWQWSHITGLYRSFTLPGTKPPVQTAAPAPGQSKFPGRVPQDQSSGTQPSGGTSTAQSQVPAVAQRVVLYEEDPNDPQGKRFVGSAIWRTETVSPGPGLAPELAVRADIEIPERRMTVTWSIRRNTDQALPASHTIEIMFNLPADFPGGGIANVPGILMKQSEQARGTPLAGLAVKVTNGFFLIGLSAVEADVTRNVALLKERPWFDIPVVYTNNGRAILAMEKGPPGDRAFAEAFAAWEKK